MADYRRHLGTATPWAHLRHDRDEEPAVVETSHSERSSRLQRRRLPHWQPRAGQMHPLLPVEICHQGSGRLVQQPRHLQVLAGKGGQKAIHC